MRFRCKRKELYGALQTVTRAVSGRSTLPILHNVLIEPAGTSVKLAATDLELAISCSFPARVDEGGAMTVPARLIADLVSYLPETDVAVAVDDRNTAVFTCAESEYRILGLPPEEFPPLPEVEGDVALEIPPGTLRKMIRQVSIAVDNDDTRPVLTGISIRLSRGRLRMAATDLFRLAVRSCTVSAPTAAGEQGGEPIPPEAEDAARATTATIPGRAMAELLRVLPEEGGGPVRVCLDASQARFATDRVTLVSRLLAGRFPPFERLLPSGFTTRLLIPTGPFQRALRRAALVARENADRVMLRTEGARLTVTAQAGELGQAYEALEVVHEGEDFEIAINCRYLLDVLAVLEDEGLYLDLAGPQEAAAIRPVDDPDYLVLVMPQRLG